MGGDGHKTGLGGISTKKAGRLFMACSDDASVFNQPHTEKKACALWECAHPIQGYVGLNQLGRPVLLSHHFQLL